MRLERTAVPFDGCRGVRDGGGEAVDEVRDVGRVVGPIHPEVQQKREQPREYHGGGDGFLTECGGGWGWMEGVRGVGGDNKGFCNRIPLDYSRNSTAFGVSVMTLTAYDSHHEAIAIVLLRVTLCPWL